MTPPIHLYGTAYGFDIDPGPWRHLRLSSEACGVTVNGYGSGPFLYHYKAKVLDMITYLESISSEYIFYVDSCDSIVARWSPEDSFKVLEFYDAPMVMSAEKNLHPFKWQEDRFPPAPGPWKYLNSGGFFGERNFIIDGLRKLTEIHYRRGAPDNDGSDQGYWNQLWLDTKSFAMDVECRLFQTLFMEEEGDFSLVDGKFRNNFFPGSSPAILHFNGNATGIDRWLKDLHGV